MAQHEAGKEAIALAGRPELLVAELKEHVETSERYALLLDFIDALRWGKTEPKLIVGASPEELTA